MDKEKYTPVPGCNCDVCIWAIRRIWRERRLAEDLEQNYARYLAGELVSSEAKENSPYLP